MANGTRTRAAIGVLVVAAVLALVLGSEPMIRALGRNRDSFGGLVAVVQRLARPNWYQDPLGVVGRNDVGRYLFVVLWPTITAALALGLGDANRFLAGWAAAVGGGVVAGGIQFATLDVAEVFRSDYTRLHIAFDGAGSGATFGLLVGWTLGIVLLVLGAGEGAGHRGQFTTGAAPPPTGGPASATAGPPTSGWPAPPATPGAPHAPRLPPRPAGGEPTGVLPPSP